jgi:MFS family permease
LRWRTSVYVIFALSGAGLSTWFSRLPTSRDHLHASTGEMGLLVLGLSIGSITGLMLSSRIVERLGPKTTILGSLLLTSVALVLISVGASVLSAYWVVFTGLACYGTGAGTCNVAMNVEAAGVERALRRSLMPMFHACFSLGGVVGAGLGALASALSVDITIHFTLVALVTSVAAYRSVRHLQPHDVEKQGKRERPAAVASVWREPRTLLIGLVVLGTSFAAGAANDWVALAMVDGHGVGDATGAVAVGVYVTFATVARVMGGSLLDRYGRVAVLRTSAGIGVAGLVVFIFVADPLVALVGVALWGLGAALGFPVGMSAAADDPIEASRRISAVATIGYFATLVGPLGIGFLAEQVGLLHALLVVLVFVVAAGAVSPAARRPVTRTPFGETV